MAQLECAAAPVPWSDGFETTTSSNATTLVRAKNVRRCFLKIYDDALGPELCATLAADAVARGRPWGCYVPLAGLADESRDPIGDERQGWARRVVCAILARARGDISLDAAHGVAVWCLAAPLGASVDYHVDYCELHRRETNEIVTPLYAATVHVSDLEEGPHVPDERRIEGGAFLVNSRGLAHYAECGYKQRLAPNAFAGTNWHRVPYRRGRATVHDGEWPHAAEQTTKLPPSRRRVILGLNVFGANVAEVNLRAPEHSDAFNTTVRLYQAAARGTGGGGLTVEKLKKNKPLARLFVGLARARETEESTAVFAAGERVRARWRTGVRFHPATVATVRADGCLDLVYDDGFKWDGAPRGVARKLGG